MKIYSKASLAFCIAFGFVSLVTSNTYIKDFDKQIDGEIFDKIHAILSKKYPGELKTTQCMVNNFRMKRIAEKFHPKKLLTNEDKLAEHIEPYINKIHAGELLRLRTISLLIFFWDFCRLQVRRIF